MINPNSSEAVTQAMDACLDVVRADTHHTIRCVTLAEAPTAIESQSDIERVEPLLVKRVAAEAASAYVIACFSDPGLAELRQHTAAPVVGIGEAGYLAALSFGGRFGVVSILESSIPRHARHIAQLGLSSRLAADRALGLGVAALSGAGVVDAIVAVGRVLRDEDGADALVLGCAGMGQHRRAVEAALGLPVVDPVQVGALLAASMLTLDYCQRHHPAAA